MDKGISKMTGDLELELYVKNVPSEMDEATMRRDFLECGGLENLHVPVEDGCKSTRIACALDVACPVLAWPRALRRGTPRWTRRL